MKNAICAVWFLGNENLYGAENPSLNEVFWDPVFLCRCTLFLWQSPMGIFLLWSTVSRERKKICKRKKRRKRRKRRRRRRRTTMITAVSVIDLRSPMVSLYILLTSPKNKNTQAVHAICPSRPATRWWARFPPARATMSCPTPTTSCPTAPAWCPRAWTCCPTAQRSRQRAHLPSLLRLLAALLATGSQGPQSVHPIWGGTGSANPSLNTNCKLQIANPFSN